MIGTTLGNRYKLVSELGSGGMAWVYLADDVTQGGQVAVKILYPQLSHEGGFLQRFVQEARLAMSLSADPQANVARVMDYGSDRDTHYLVMEYVSGRDLRRVLDDEGPFSWQEALDIGRQVALGLAHAHRHGIVHRDIKPGNIMLGWDGTVRVLDFGVARALGSPALTQSGFVGSPYYASPEQALGRPVDIRADLYSLGVVLCEMLTGKLPFEADTPWGVLTQHIASPPPLLDETHPDIPGPVARLVRQAMAKRPEDRFQTPADMVQALESVLLGIEAPPVEATAEVGMLEPLLAGLYERAEQAAGAGLWQEAVDFLTQILKLDPRYRDVADRLAEAGRQVRLSALYAGARRSLKTGQWADALAQLEEIARTLPDYRDVPELRAFARQKQDLDQLYRQAIERLQERDWAVAIERLERVHDREPGYLQTAELLSTARKELERQKHSSTLAVDQPASRSNPEPGRPRSLVWAVVAVLLVALALESLLVLRPWQWAASAASATRAAVASVPPIVAPSTPVAVGPGAIADAIVHPSATPRGLHQSAIATATWTATPLPSPSPSRTPAPVSPSPSITARPTLTAGPLPTLPPTVVPSPTAAAPRPASVLDPPLGGQIAFPRFDPARGTYDVYICRVDGSGCHLVTREASQPDLLPDGSQVVVHSWQAGARGLDVRALDGRLIWRITDEVEAARPSVDAQGDLYVYHSRRDADRRARLYRTAGTETMPMWNGSSVVAGQSPSWLLDGRIVYSGCVGNACGILSVRADGTSPRQVVPGGTEANPEVSPDGRRLVFMSRRDGNWEIYQVDVDGTDLKRLTARAGDDGLPTWSPDGRHIAFVRNDGGRWQVWAMDADGSHQRELFSIGGPLDGLVRSASSYETYGWVEERISWGPLP